MREALDSGQPVNSRSPGGVTGLILLAYLVCVSRDVTETAVRTRHCREGETRLGPGDTLPSALLTHLSLTTQRAGDTGTAGTATRSGNLGLWETDRRPSRAGEGGDVLI